MIYWYLKRGFQYCVWDKAVLKNIFDPGIRVNKHSSVI